MSSADRRAVHEAGHAAACLTYGAPIVSISSASGRAYLHRGRWQPPAAIAVEAMATVCLAGAAAEAMICGGDDLGDAIDIEMAMACLRSAYSGLDLQRQFARAQAAARRLVHTASVRRQILIIADALKRQNTIDGAELNELLAASAPPPAWV